MDPKDKTSTTQPTGPDPDPKATAAPATPAEPTADVVSIDTARKEGATAGRKAERDRASAIRQACDLAGCPERFGEFFDSDLTPEKVGEKLLKERADKGGPEVRGQHSGIRSGDERPEAQIDSRAVYRRWNDPQARASHARKEA